MVVVHSGDSERPPTAAAGTSWLDSDASEEDAKQPGPRTADAPVGSRADNRPTLLGLAPPKVPAEFLTTEVAAECLDNDSSPTPPGEQSEPPAPQEQLEQQPATPARTGVLRSNWTFALLGAVLGSMATLAVVNLRPTKSASEYRPAEAATPASPASMVARRSAIAATPLAALQPEPVASTALAASAQAPSSMPSPALDAKTTRVTLEVLPPDAKVTYSGGTWTGPIGEVEIPRGGRVVLQIVRKGYAARKLVLDGSKPRVAVGLVKKPSSNQVAP